MPYVLLTAQLLLVLVFAWSALSKSTPGSFRAFHTSLAAFVPFGPATRKRLSAVVVGAELIVAPLIAVPATKVLGLLVAASILAVFTIVMVRALRRGVHSPCNCFGSSGDVIAFPHVARNLFLLGTAVAGVALAITQPPTPLSIPHYVVSVLVTAMLVLAIRLTDVIAFLFSPTSRRAGSQPTGLT